MHVSVRMRVIALVLLLGLVLGAPLSGQAQGDAPPAQYGELIERALVESSASRWPEALALFRQAHAAYPNARTHRGIGMVAYEVRDYVEAHRHLTLALSSTRRPLEAAQRAEVTKLLERTRVFVARYALDALPAQATFTVDGASTPREPDGTLVLPLGAHHVEVRANAPPRHGSAELQVKGGEQGPLPVVLEEVKSATAPAPVAAAPADVPLNPSQVAPDTLEEPRELAAQDTLPDDDVPDAVPAQATSSGPGALPIVLTATGGVMLVAGAVLLVMGMNDVSTVEDAAVPTEWSTLASANDRAPILTGVGFGLLGAGAVLATVGGVLWVGSGEDSNADGEPDGFSLRMRACF